MDAALERWLRLGQERWPAVAVAPEALARHLQDLGIAPANEHPHAADLYLACGCALGDPAALGVFERELMPVVRTAALRIDSSGDFADEVMQSARERLLVPRPERPPRVAEYGGQGSLRAWVRVAGMRIAMNLLRSRRHNVLIDDDDFFDAVLEGQPADRERARARYADAAAESLRAAFATLSARERNLLRMHHLHGLTAEELAPTFQVHRATVARWLARARERLLAATRQGLQERLAIGSATADSILRELQSRMDVTVSRLLAE